MRTGRFRMLERARPARAAPAPTPLATRGRIEALRAGPERVESSALELDIRRPDDQPFVRCARCGTDSHVSARFCANCEAPFDAPEQRAFNERLWEQLRRAARAELDAGKARPSTQEVPPSPPTRSEEVAATPGIWAPVLRPLVAAAAVAVLAFAFRWKVALGLALLCAGYWRWRRRR